MMIERARRGLTVVRLKGGDPFIFGRGGEEVEALVEAGVPFEVVPGVTSPLGIAAYSGVPLTHRAHTKVVTFVTGHDVASIDWSKVGQSETLVIFMGIFSIHEIAVRDYQVRPVRRDTRDCSALGNAAGSGNRHGYSGHHCRSDRSSGNEAARDGDYRGCGGAA